MSPSKRTRFAKWLSFGPPETRQLGSLVESELVPALEKLGFSVTGDRRLLVDLSVLGRELELERSTDDCVDVITINFDKYHRPRFQVSAARRLTQPPHAFVRACNLVPSSRHSYFFWGKPWWLPTRLWTTGRAFRLVASIRARLPQLDLFLSTTQRGPHVSK